MEQLDVFISVKPKPKQPNKVRENNTVPSKSQLFYRYYCTDDQVNHGTYGTYKKRKNFLKSQSKD